MNNPTEQAKELLDEAGIVLVDDDPAIKAVAAALAERDSLDGEPYTDREKHLAQIADLKAALNSVSFPDRRWK